MSLEVAAEVDWKTKRDVLLKNKVDRFLTFLVFSIYFHSLGVVLCPPCTTWRLIWLVSGKSTRSN